MESFETKSSDGAAVVENHRQQAGEEAGITADVIAEAIVKALKSIKVYVVESEITEAQNNVRTIVEQASF